MLINMLVSEANKQGNWLSYTFSLHYHSNSWNHGNHSAVKTTNLFLQWPQTSCDSAWPYCNDYPAQFRRGGKNLGNLRIVDIDVDPACTSGFLNTIHIPSTFVYKAISKFDRKLDVFSFGHLALREIEFGYKQEKLQSATTMHTSTCMNCMKPFNSTAN